MKKLTSFLDKNGFIITGEYDKVTETLMFSTDKGEYYLDPEFNSKNKVSYWCIKNSITGDVLGVGSTQGELINSIKARLMN